MNAFGIDFSQICKRWNDATVWHFVGKFSWEWWIREWLHSHNDVSRGRRTWQSNDTFPASYIENVFKNLGNRIWIMWCKLESFYHVSFCFGNLAKHFSDIPQDWSDLIFYSMTQFISKPQKPTINLSAPSLIAGNRIEHQIEKSIWWAARITRLENGLQINKKKHIFFPAMMFGVKKKWTCFIGFTKKANHIQMSLAKW